VEGRNAGLFGWWQFAVWVVTRRCFAGRRERERGGCTWGIGRFDRGVNGESVGMGGEDVVRISGEREENGRGES